MDNSRQGTLTDLHILVVEDDLDAREILKSLLEYFGALVTTAGAVRDAMRALISLTPDVVIADMILGKNSASALLDEARQHGSRVPFIAVSVRDFDGQELKHAGFAAYLRKPLDHTTLVDTVLAVSRTR